MQVHFNVFLICLFWELDTCLLIQVACVIGAATRTGITVL